MQWIDELADALGVDRLSAADTERLLGTARETAHRVERRITPLSTYLLGVAAGRGIAGGAPGEVALTDAIAILETSLPGGDGT
jgi:hypothetical protein